MRLALVGHGSIGRRYKESLIKKGFKKNDIYIIDNNHKVLNELKGQNFNCFEDISELYEIVPNIELGVVANWGPDHISSANKLLDIGCKKIIIEKPISTSIEDLISFKEKCNKKNIFVTAHYLWRYTDIINRVWEIENKFKLGDSVGIRIYGGAVCFSTNGTHFFDLACQVLNSNPATVTADLGIDYINPRDSSLAYIDGNASYKMANNTFIHVSFSNKNSQAIMFEIIYRNGLISIDSNGDLRCYTRDEEQVIKYLDKITRYGPMNFVEESHCRELSTVDNVLDNLINDMEPKLGLEEAEVSLRMVLGAIQSHLYGKRIELDKISDTHMRIS